LSYILFRNFQKAFCYLNAIFSMMPKKPIKKIFYFSKKLHKVEKGCEIIAFLTNRGINL